MIEPTSIKQGDTFKIVERDELWDLGKYQDDFKNTLPGLEGWNKANDFILPIIKDGLYLPPQTTSNHFISWLEKDAVVSVVRVLFHSNKPANFSGVYQCLLVNATIDNASKPGFIWSIYGGKDFIEPLVRQPPATSNTPTSDTPPTTTPVPTLPQTGTEITVYAGQTLVIELKTTGKVDDSKEDDAEKENIGSIEVELVDTEGNPYTQTDLVHLIGDQGIYTVPINQATGKGSKSGIKAGTYDLALLLGTVYFASDKAELSQEAAQELEKVRSKLVNAGSLDFKKLKCVGYADSDGSQTYNDNLCLKRALSVKEQLLKIQEKVKYIDTGLGGMLPGKEEEVKKKNRKVEVLAAITSNLS